MNLDRCPTKYDFNTNKVKTFENYGTLNDLLSFSKLSTDSTALNVVLKKTPKNDENILSVG